MLARRLAPSELTALTPDDLAGAVLLAPSRLPEGQLRKGTRVDLDQAGAILRAARAGGLPEVRAAWLDAGDLHEDEAARRLAGAAAGAGVELRPPRQSRLDLTARWDGVLHVRVAALTRLNAIDPLEVFTLYHGQAVAAGQLVGSVKVAPHVVAEAAVMAGVRIAEEAGALLEVHAYRALEVGAIAQEAISGEALARFETGARFKIEALGSRFAGTMVVGDTEPQAAERAAHAALIWAVRERELPVVLVGGVSAGDPLSPFYAALENLGGRVLRRGVPAHPGSMIWLAELEGSRLLGLPQCGMFTLATAADLVLPRLLTGEALTAADLADLAHGGVLVKEMRFRFPPYAQGLEAPDG
jgi:hypothetical protein